MSYVRDLIRGELDAGGLDPHDVAHRVADLLTPEEAVAALRECLPSLAREMVRQRRVPPPAGASRSPRWERASRAWLASQYAVNGVWKRLADCSREDVDAIAADYQMRAAENAAWATRFRLLADRMTRAGAACVADLDAAMLEELAA